MLWSCPIRAHRPIVPGVNFTFDDASRSAASDTEIQSDGGFDICQSGSFAAGEACVEVVGAPAADSPLAGDSALAGDFGASPELVPVSSGPVRLGRPPFDRSLRAQPVPLK
jgi:hypothetical protein